MKKALCILVVMTLCVLPVTVFADFNSKVQNEIRKEIGAFYQRNEGNKITIDVMDGLMLHLNQIFDMNIIKPPEPKKDKSEHKPVKGVPTEAPTK